MCTRKTYSNQFNPVEFSAQLRIAVKKLSTRHGMSNAQPLILTTSLLSSAAPSREKIIQSTKIKAKEEENIAILQL